MVPSRMSRRMWLASSDWWALKSEMTALSSRDFLASRACCPARIDRRAATPAATAAITAERTARSMVLPAPVFTPTSRPPEKATADGGSVAPAGGSMHHPTGGVSLAQLRGPAEGSVPASSGPWWRVLRYRHGLPLHAGGPGGVQALSPAVGLRGQGAPEPRACRGGRRPRPGPGGPRRPGRVLLPRDVGLAALGGAAPGPPGVRPVGGRGGAGRIRHRGHAAAPYRPGAGARQARPH